MNVLLEKLLENDILTEKDKFEIRQFFQIVSDDKKQNILRNFDNILSSILKIKIEMRKQQEILLWKTISNIEKAIKIAKNNWIINATTDSIQQLKDTI